jgi:predicted RNase H-like nuclease
VVEADAYRETGRHELVEVHPELVFAELAGAPMAYPKKTWNGQHARRAALARVGVDLPDQLGGAVGGPDGFGGAVGVPDQLGGAGGVPVDDVLDAAAVAWCAYRIARGRGRHVPDPPDQFDHHGRPIVIYF